MELLILLAFLMGWVVAQVQESQSRKARLLRLESLQSQLVEIQELVKAWQQAREKDSQ